MFEEHSLNVRFGEFRTFCEHSNCPNIRTFNEYSANITVLLGKPTDNFGQLRPSCLLYGREPITLWPSLAQCRRRAALGRSTGVRTAHWRTIPFGLIVPFAYLRTLACNSNESSYIFVPARLTMSALTRRRAARAGAG